MNSEMHWRRISLISELKHTMVVLLIFTFTFHFHALEKEMATHPSVLAWRIPGMGEPGGLLSMGPHRVGHGWSNSAAAERAYVCCCSVTKSCLTFCDPMTCSMPGFHVLHYLSEFAQTHVHWSSDAIQLSNSLSLPFPSASVFPSIRVFSN